MDHFGIGAAMKGMAKTYFQSARHTGRTVSMLESLKDGDRVVFNTVREANRIRRLLLEYGLKDVECIVISPTEAHRLMERGTNQGRTIFDHSWVEQFYLDCIESCAKEIDFYQRKLSGFGKPHRETRRKAIEMAKWDF